jgi:hypothetical protein
VTAKKVLYTQFSTKEVKRTGELLPLKFEASIFIVTFSPSIFDFIDIGMQTASMVTSLLSSSSDKEFM